MKKRFSLLLAAVMLLAAAGCAPAAADPTATPAPAQTGSAQPSEAPADNTQPSYGPGLGGTVDNPYIITAGCTAPNTTDPTNGFVRAHQVLNDRLMELSGGTMGFELVMGGVYGSTVQHFAQLKAGTLDGFVSGFDVATNLAGTEDFYAVAMPFVFNNDEHMDLFLESDLWAQMTESMRANNGIVYAGLYGHQLPRILTSTREIVHPGDVAGLKIRVPESDVQIRVWTQAGASPMQIAATEMYSALDTGVADAQENDIVGSGSLKVYEVCPYYTEIDYIRQCLMVYMSEITWNRMNEQERGWWTQALEEACEACTTAYLDKYNDAKQTVIDSGGTIVEFDYDEWKEFFTGIVLSEFDGKYFRAGLYEEIQALYQK